MKTVYIRNGEVVPPSQTYFWTPAWQSQEAEATADLAAGNFREFSSPEDVVAWLFDSQE